MVCVWIHQIDGLGETEVFQTLPTTPRDREEVEEDDGVICLIRILPIDATYQDSPDMLPGGKPKPPRDFDQETLEDETSLNQWLLDGSSRRSHQHWKQVYEHCKRNNPTPADINGGDVILKQHNVLRVKDLLFRSLTQSVGGKNNFFKDYGDFSVRPLRRKPGQP